MKFILIVSALSLLLAGCGKSPSSAQMMEELSGHWGFNSDSRYSMILWQTTNGSYVAETSPRLGGGIWTNRGAWQVTNNILVITLSNSVFPNVKIPAERDKIVHVDDHDLRLLSLGDKKELRFHK